MKNEKEGVTTYATKIENNCSKCGKLGCENHKH